jgi:hypothetical protein
MGACAKDSFGPSPPLTGMGWSFDSVRLAPHFAQDDRVLGCGEVEAMNHYF